MNMDAIHASTVSHANNAQSHARIRALHTRAFELRKLSLSESLDRRHALLLRLKKSIESREEKIMGALAKDLGKPQFEAFANEYGFVLGELKHTIKEFRDWAQDVTCETPVALWPAKSKIVFEPKGVVLILSPWNYPFQLSIGPLIAALAAGNLAVLKPSEFAPATSRVIAEMIADAFSDGEVLLIEGDGETASHLTSLRWDHVFFTGSTEVGRKVMAACAQHLTPVTLELGGKSPCIFGPFSSSSKNFDVALRRLVWGKFMNAGQTCIAPDYVLIHQSNRARFLEAFPKVIRDFYGENPLQSSSLSKIISERHFDRLERMLEECKVLFGGQRDRATKSFAPTLIDGSFGGSFQPSTSDELPRIWKEEIFGPLLPLVTWTTESEIEAIIEKNPRPLALYVLNDDSSESERLLRRFSFGGGASGDTLVHVANPQLPFGGISESGHGSYHGKWGFQAFSHSKSLVLKSYAMDLAVRYPPYGDAWKKMKGLLT